jgi:1-acyl-sn-glycerol-3-phosphate acyltransferase
MLNATRCIMIEALLSHVGHAAARLYTGTALDTEIRWHRYLPPGAKILAANHPSTTDPFFLLALTPEPVSLLVTDAAFRIPIAGRLLLGSGHVPAVRHSAGATVEVLRRKLLEGRTVAIFPEGALSPFEEDSRAT